ncbi:hypothetical protein HMPREF9072_01827 [Capnocytophaga sp. oral taxon 324 str. F0483]|nr:hypothetical protein HMPREF9072_01827 [Capnocytophaga sp. oral taxon 324 str. F0483]
MSFFIQRIVLNISGCKGNDNLLIWQLANELINVKWNEYSW